MNSDTRASAVQRNQPAEFAETCRFDVRSVTGARYTLVEQARRGDDFDAGPRPNSQRRYRTAYAGLPVTANDDGSFTIVDTHTRLVRLEPD